jgi:hypothetical protein
MASGRAELSDAAQLGKITGAKYLGAGGMGRFLYEKTSRRTAAA